MGFDVIRFSGSQSFTDGLLGRRVAQALGFGRIDGNQTVFHGGIQYHTERQPKLVDHFSGIIDLAVHELLHIVDGDRADVTLAEVWDQVLFQV